MGDWRAAVLAVSLTLLSLTFLALQGPESPHAAVASGALSLTASQSASAGDVEDLMGDTDCSGIVTSIDALQVLRGVAGIGEPAQCLEAAGDTDCDSERDSVDALRILRHVASLAVGAPPGCTPIGEALAPPPPPSFSWGGTLRFDSQVDISLGVGRCYEKHETVVVDVPDAVFVHETTEAGVQTYKLQSGHITYTHDMHDALEYDPDRLCYNVARDCTAHAQGSLDVTPGMSELWIIESQEGATYVLTSESVVEITATPSCSIGELDQQILGVALAVSLVNEYDGSDHLAGAYTAGNPDETSAWTWDLRRSAGTAALGRR